MNNQSHNNTVVYDKKYWKDKLSWTFNSISMNNQSHNNTVVYDKKYWKDNLSWTFNNI